MASKIRKPYLKPKITIKTMHYKLFYSNALLPEDEGVLLAGTCTGLCMVFSGIWYCSGGGGTCP